ncbi:MAG: hypothetical protein IJY67_09685 [Paludibacteraceae bacterium]|nr:hypothetical protein [Paludibacteraceae bacterium]
MKNCRFYFVLFFAVFSLNVLANMTIYDFYNVVKEAMPMINQERVQYGLNELKLKNISTKEEICSLQWMCKSFGFYPSNITKEEVFNRVKECIKEYGLTSVMLCYDEDFYWLYFVRDVNEVNVDREAFEYEVLRLVNIERTKRGLAPLKMSKDLHITARIKAEEMVIYNYYSHNSPVYGSAEDLIESRGKKYYYTGENIAKGQMTPEQVMNCWMNSSGHKGNILNPNFLYIGIGYYKDHWVQQFAGRQMK